MFGSYEGALVDQHVAETTTPPAGCRTLCQHPGCGRPIEEVLPTFPGGKSFWMHLEPPDVPSHRATPVDQPEPSPGERLVASVTESYERHRRLQPVRALHVVLMADRLVAAAQDAVAALAFSGKDSPVYRRAHHTYCRRAEALRRLAYALERQTGGGLR